MKKEMNEKSHVCEHSNCKECKLRKGLRAIAFMTMERLENYLIESYEEVVKDFCFNLLKLYEEKSETQRGLDFLIGLCDFYEDEFLRDLLEGLVLGETIKTSCFIKLCVLYKEFSDEEYALHHVYEDDEY